MKRQNQCASSALQLLLILLIQSAVPEITSDDLTETAEEMSIDDLDHTGNHLLTDCSAGHLSDRTERHVVNEQDIEVRFSGSVRFPLLAFKNAVNSSTEPALRVLQLADRVVGSELARPGPVRNRSAEKFFFLAVRHFCDLSAEI